MYVCVDLRFGGSGEWKCRDQRYYHRTPVIIRHYLATHEPPEALLAHTWVRAPGCQHTCTHIATPRTAHTALGRGRPPMSSSAEAWIAGASRVRTRLSCQVPFAR